MSIHWKCKQCGLLNKAEKIKCQACFKLDPELEPLFTNVDFGSQLIMCLDAISLINLYLSQVFQSLSYNSLSNYVNSSNFDINHHKNYSGNQCNRSINANLDMSEGYNTITKSLIENYETYQEEYHYQTPDVILNNPDKYDYNIISNYNMNAFNMNNYNMNNSGNKYDYDISKSYDNSSNMESYNSISNDCCDDCSGSDCLRAEAANNGNIVWFTENYDSKSNIKQYFVQQLYASNAGKDMPEIEIDYYQFDEEHDFTQCGFLKFEEISYLRNFNGYRIQIDDSKQMLQYLFDRNKDKLTNLKMYCMGYHYHPYPSSMSSTHKNDTTDHASSNVSSTNDDFINEIDSIHSMSLRDNDITQLSHQLSHSDDTLQSINNIHTSLSTQTPIQLPIHNNNNSNETNNNSNETHNNSNINGDHELHSHNDELHELHDDVIDVLDVEEEYSSNHDIIYVLFIRNDDFHNSIGLCLSFY